MIYDATICRSVTVYFDAIRMVRLSPFARTVFESPLDKLANLGYSLVNIGSFIE